MSAFYRDARLKINRAEKHLADFKATIVSLENSDIVTVEHRPNGGHTLKHELPDFRDALDNLSLIAGDVIHNLHTALDFAWYSTIERCLPDKIHGLTKFPIRPTRQDVEGALHGIEVDTRCAPLFDCIVSKIQPYNGGHNRAAWTLHDLDISDKHLLLLGLDPQGYIKGITVRDESGELHRGNSVPASGIEGRFIIDYIPGLKIENKGKLLFTVTLQKAGIYNPVPVDPLLESFRNFAFHTVQLLESVQI